MRQEIQYVLLLTILSIGWMVGFIWVVVAGTARYVNSMYAIDLDRYVYRQVPLTNESSTVLSECNYVWHPQFNGEEPL